MDNASYLWAAIAIIAFVTAALRFLPFAVFQGKRQTPRLVAKLGRLLPYAIMGMLVVYCLREISFASVGGFLPQMIAVLVVAVLYVWRRNTLLSIIVGTLCYMLLVQVVFVPI